MMKKVLMLVAVLAVTGIVSAELLQDPGFESGFMAWDNGLNIGVWELRFGAVGGGSFVGTSWYYTSHQVIVEPWEARGGDKYLRMGNFAPSWNWASWGYTEIGQKVTVGVTPGVEYTLSANFMDDRGFWGNTGTVNVHLKLNFFNAGAKIGGNNSSDAIVISSDWDLGWQQASFTFTAPAGSDEIRALVGQGDGSSFVRIDDVSLTECSGDLAVAPDPPNISNDPNNPTVIVGYTCQTDLSWETCSVSPTFDVYLAATDDPNYVFVGGDLIASGVTTNTVPVTLANNTDYAWRVDGTGTGEVWMFATGDVPPSVDAGDDQYGWLDPTSATVDLVGTICDDGNSSVTYLWSSPDAEVVITSDTSLVTTATITATGSYTITLTATDTSGSAGDTMVANVYDDACEAAKADPTDYTTPFDSDLSGDCLVNLNDFKIMAIEFLDCASAKLGCTP